MLTIRTALSILIGLQITGSAITGTFRPTGSLLLGRDRHEAVLLQDGTVLVVGGSVGDSSADDSASAERYDRATETWTNAGTMSRVRSHHTATALADGRVLVAGSFRAGPVLPDNSAELYDPSRNAWSGAGVMAVGRWGHTATLLTTGPHNGMVLVAGGMTAQNAVTRSAELFDPASGRWMSTGVLHVARAFHTATALMDGQVLVAGGALKHNGDTTTSSVEIYNPVTGVWSETGALSRKRIFHAAARLQDGRVIVAGGLDDAVAGPAAIAAVELYDPSRRVWAVSGSMNVPRARHTASALPNGTVLVVGGSSDGSAGSATASGETYDPVAGAWTPAGSMALARVRHTATILVNGSVLIAGGSNSEAKTHHASVQLFELDADRDGIPDADDNCQEVSNPAQVNTDNDAEGDACDADDDGDGVPDTSDNCPLTANQDQADVDQDRIGDACDGAVGPPPSKDACKNGVWQQYNSPPFRNQGECLKFLRNRR